jgi:hypothetical protein
MAVEASPNMQEVVAEEKKTMTQSTMDVYTRVWWDLVKMEIMEKRRESRKLVVAVVVELRTS